MMLKTALDVLTLGHYANWATTLKLYLERITYLFKSDGDVPLPNMPRGSGATGEGIHLFGSLLPLIRMPRRGTK
ncbi:Uncharacterised protein [Corynebacterium amycolatum]|nr:Uncharacterised protein [Corynebacterium amycolatum]